MDGDQRMKQHGRLMPRSANPAASGHAPQRFDPAMHPRGGDPTGMSQPPDRAQMSYDCGYTNSSFQGGSLQTNEAGSYGHELSRPRATLSTASQAVQQQQRRRPAPEQSSFVPYESALLYGFSQQGSGAGAGPAQGSFEIVPQYSTRQSAAMEALSNQFAVPQYFAPEEHQATGVPGGLSPYLNPHLPYNHPGPMPRSTSSQPFPATMTDFTSIGTASSARVDPPSMSQTAEPPQQPEPDPSSLDGAYSQYQRALRSIFDHVRAGRLVDASRSLLEISEWLVTNARDLGILRDDHILYPDHLQLWNDFNICWLAVCQKQKDLTRDLLATGHQHAQASLLSRDRMETMGKDLIQLCDQLEQHGLVDYQMGIWEEEILCVLGQCLDLTESRPELLRIQTVPEPATAAPRP